MHAADINMSAMGSRSDLNLLLGLILFLILFLLFVLGSFLRLNLVGPLLLFCYESASAEFRTMHWGKNESEQQR